MVLQVEPKWSIKMGKIDKLDCIKLKGFFTAKWRVEETMNGKKFLLAVQQGANNQNT